MSNELHDRMNEDEVGENRQERGLNAGCYEYPRKSLFTYTEDYDEAPVRLAEHDVLTGLRRSGNERSVKVQKMLVRDDMPANPFVFAKSKEDLEAAFALDEYQHHMQQHGPVDELYRPCFEDGTTPDELPGEQYRHLHYNPGQNDEHIEWVLEKLAKLKTDPEYLYWRNYPEQCEAGSGVSPYRHGLEYDLIGEIWNDL
jgi:hypothetical protein